MMVLPRWGPPGLGAGLGVLVLVWEAEHPHGDGTTVRTDVGGSLRVDRVIATCVSAVWRWIYSTSCEWVGQWSCVMMAALPKGDQDCGTHLLRVTFYLP